MKNTKLTQEYKDIKMLIGYKNSKGLSLTEEEKTKALKHMTEDEITRTFRKYIKRTGCNSLSKITKQREVVLTKEIDSSKLSS